MYQTALFQQFLFGESFRAAHTGGRAARFAIIYPGNWQVKWFGKASTAKFAIIMPSDEYWKSGPCVKELLAILKRGIPVFNIPVFNIQHTRRWLKKGL